MTTNNRRQFLQAATLTTLAVPLSRAFGESTDSPNRGANCWNLSWLDDFFAAIQQGDLDRVQRLLAENPRWPQATDSTGRSGFAVAYLCGQREIADMLIAAGYQPDLHEAALSQDWSRFDQLADAADQPCEQLVNSIHPIGGTAMFAAALGGAGTDIWRVYGKCGDPDAVADQRDALYPIQVALAQDDRETAELTAFSLLSNRTDPDPKIRSGKSPLELAIDLGSLEIVEMLIRLSADLSRPTQDGRSYVEYARRVRQHQIAEMLDRADQLPKTCQTSRYASTRDGSDYQPVEWSGISLRQRSDFVGAAHRDLNQVRRLVETDPRLAHSVATTGEGAVEAGAHMGRRDIVEYLLQQGAPYALPTAVMMDDRQTVLRLLDDDPQRIQERGAHDFALLWYPVIGACGLEMTELLLERGADVEQQHQLGTTALHWACRSGDRELIERLIQAGADVNRVGRKFGGQAQRPLELARDESVRALLRTLGAK